MMKKYRNEHPFTEEHRKRLSKSAMGNHNFGNPPVNRKNVVVTKYVLHDIITLN